MWLYVHGENFATSITEKICIGFYEVLYLVAPCYEMISVKFSWKSLNRWRFFTALSRIFGTTGYRFPLHGITPSWQSSFIISIQTSTDLIISRKRYMQSWGSTYRLPAGYWHEITVCHNSTKYAFCF